MSLLFIALAGGLLFLFSGFTGKTLAQTLRGELGSRSNVSTGFARIFDVQPFRELSTVAAVDGGGGGTSTASMVTAGGSGTVARLKSACVAIAQRQYPYKWGGGHNASFAPSGNPAGYDCSGAVSAALHAAGLLDAPKVAAGFMLYGDPGPGQHVTIWAAPGHVWMEIDGQDWGTGGMGNRGGADWQGHRHSRSGFVARHPPGL